MLTYRGDKMRDPYSNIQKSEWRAERFTNKERIKDLPMKVLKWFVIGTLFLTIEGCTHPSTIIVSPHKITYKFITDGRGKIHKYRSFPRVGSGDVAIEYCVRHKRWETISARWTHHGFLKFKVVRHRKDRRW